MSAESPITTLNRFDLNSNWKNSAVNVLASDLLSANGESNLLWTPFHYEEKDGKLFDPVRQKFIAGTAGGDEVEEGVITQLQEWFSGNDSGLAVWISPRGEVISEENGTRSRPYPEEQITIYRIGYEFKMDADGNYDTKKVLFFSWHQFKKEFANPEQIRRFIFTEEDSEESVFRIINWLKSVSEKPVADDYGDITKRRDSAVHYAGLYKSGVAMSQLAPQMDSTKFLGKNPIGCPTSSTPAPNYVSTSTAAGIYDRTESGDGLGPREFPCPACGFINTRPWGGYVTSCQNERCNNPKAVMC